jgi:2'-5' RNA ligase
MSDRAVAYRRIWKAFQGTRRVADGRHDTPDWHSRGGPFAVCCVRVPAPALQPELDSVRQLLRDDPVVRVHPDGFLHVTLQELGFVVERPIRRDEIRPERLDEFAQIAAAVAGEIGPFELSLGGVNAFQDAVFLEVGAGGGRCSWLHERLREAVGFVHEPRYSYLPHATIAHFTADAPADSYAARLAPWRDRRFGAFRVDRVEIVTLRTDEPYPPLETFAAVPLRG